VRMRVTLVAALGGLAVLAATCGGDDDEGGGGGGGGSQRGDTITVWTNEFQPDRMAATEDIFADFTAKTGIKTDLVPVPEGQLATLTTNAAAAGELPDVVIGNNMADSQAYAAQDLYDADAAQAVIDKLGKDTFSAEAIDLVTRDGKATGVPSDAWGQLLIYRRDLFRKAGLDAPQSLEDVRNAAERLHGSGMVGIALATKAGDEFTAQTIEHIALAFGCQLVNDSGDITFDSPECVDALEYYGELARDYSVEGAQDVDTTRGTYFAGRAAMLIWSPFLLDGMAGLRDDTRPSCPQCRRNPAFLAENSGLVGPLVGPAGGEGTQFGSVSTLNITTNANTEASQQLLEFMMSDGYVRWLGLSPQGKYPVRFGPEPGSQEYVTAWSQLESGVDRKAPLSQFYSKASLDSLREGVANMDRWGFPQGRGALVGALSGEQPIADAGAEVIAGKAPAEAARDAKAIVEEIQATLE
jgi:multiple sugar transport system substrate-binding protein